MQQQQRNRRLRALACAIALAWAASSSSQAQAFQVEMFSGPSPERDATREALRAVGGEMVRDYVASDPVIQGVEARVVPVVDTMLHNAVRPFEPVVSQITHDENATDEYISNADEALQRAIEMSMKHPELSAEVFQNLTRDFVDPIINVTEVGVSEVRDNVVQTVDNGIRRVTEPMRPVTHLIGKDDDVDAWISAVDESIGNVIALQPLGQEMTALQNLRETVFQPYQRSRQAAMSQIDQDVATLDSIGAAETAPAAAAPANPFLNYYSRFWRLRSERLAQQAAPVEPPSVTEGEEWAATAALEGGDANATTLEGAPDAVETFAVASEVPEDAEVAPAPASAPAAMPYRFPFRPFQQQAPVPAEPVVAATPLPLDDVSAESAGSAGSTGEGGGAPKREARKRAWIAKRKDEFDALREQLGEAFTEDEVFVLFKMNPKFLVRHPTWASHMVAQLGRVNPDYTHEDLYESLLDELRKKRMKMQANALSKKGCAAEVIEEKLRLYWIEKERFDMRKVAC